MPSVVKSKRQSSTDMARRSTQAKAIHQYALRHQLDPTPTSVREELGSIPMPV